MSRFLIFIIACTGFSYPRCFADDAAIRLHSLFDEQWQALLQERPTYASKLGDRRFHHQWPDLSLPGEERRNQRVRAALDALHRIEIEELSDADRLNYLLFDRQYSADIREQKFRMNLLALNQLEGIQNRSQLADLLSFDSVRDYEDWIKRLEGFSIHMAQTMALLRQGIREGLVHPRVIMERVPGQIRQQIVDRPEDSPFYKPFRAFEVEVSDKQKLDLQRRAKAAISRCILPSYRTFLEFIESEYIPACYDEVGCWRRPDGQNMYAALAERFTTTKLTPQEIHEIGLSEVARIRTLMEDIRVEVGFEGSFREFLTYLRNDSQFYYDDPEELLEAYRACCRRIDPGLPALFNKLPATWYEVIPIPMQMAPDTTTAYYQPPSADGRRLGAYYVNLFRPEARPIYEIEALSLHESVPGHHLQIALSMEIEDIPEFRRYGGYTVFVEGWGLYSEKLGEELGMYQDPYSRFGQLTYEMWRAVRLVVDTGMHSLKWERERAITFFQENTAKSILDIENEIDRYIAWPGQALAYKIGEIKIRELRSLSEKQLGDQFDVREFHDIVLQNGAVPLDVLEQVVHEWLQSR